MLKCGTLDWSEINPDIFGSMIQAVVQPSQREGLGMHYTSVENIMRVIRPLFLDDLYERFDQADTVRKLDWLLEHICEIKVFDPACGSGNFLVIAYKELRKLEHRILERLGDLDPNKVGMFKLSGVKLDHFFGIEIDDFAHEIAILSLWLAKHQMNVEFHALFGVEISLIPLKDTGNISCDNAARVDWREVCSGDENTYVCGNPPYLGSRKLGAEHKADFALYFGDSKAPGTLDYISLWFLKGADFIVETSAKLGFVSTNSICQGGHVSPLWTRLFDKGATISFAHTSFPWSNNARGGAGVSCVVIGLTSGDLRQRLLTTPEGHRRVANINPYLVASPDNTVIEQTSSPLSPRPLMLSGSKPRDGGFLLLSPQDRAAIVERDPQLDEVIRPFVGSRELIRGEQRFCLWIEDEDLELAMAEPLIAHRVERVRQRRLTNSQKSVRDAASTSHRFTSIVHRDEQCLIIPSVSSERREYIPIGFLSAGSVVSNAAFVVYGSNAWLFALLHSKMHVAWVAGVCVRLRTDYQYSSILGYNTFPFPDPKNDGHRERLTEMAFRILEARETWSDLSLADLYDPEKMPANLRAAHDANDSYVDTLYGIGPSVSDSQRMEVLLPMYAALVEEAG